MLTESRNSRTPIPKGVIHLKTNARKLTLIILGLIAVQFLTPQRLEAQEQPAQDQPAQTEPAKRTPEQIAEVIDTYMNEAVARDQFTGTLLVARDGLPIISRGYGKASIELNVPNTPQTVFRIASITKQFTAMAVMILQERGKLKVSDAICKYLSDCPKTWKPITLRHLLTHTSGIWNYTQAEDVLQTHFLPMTRIQAISYFRNKPLEFMPGEKWNYSNSGYFLLGMVIERASHQTYESFLLEHVFKPLGMKNTGFDVGHRIIKNLASGYTKNPKGSVVPNLYTGQNVFSDGGLYSTTEDLLLWDQALYTEKLVSKKSLKEIFTPFKSKTNQDFGYGYGWFIGQMLEQPMQSHTGGLPGFVTLIMRFPTVNTTVILLTNSDATNLGIIRLYLATLALP
jgi:CubicO group peptidase (beta-lactamase class C family)